jgi:SAM-dependent MidA family methyltransferase
VLKEGSQVEKLKQEQKNILQECREAVRLHEGIEKIPEAQNPLAGFKELIERLIKTSTEYQQQVVTLQKEKEEVNNNMT